MRFALLIAATLVAIPLHAQNKGDPLERGSGNEAFRALDRNGDGFVTRQEAAADADLAKDFGAADANRDGRLTEAEFVKYHQARDKQYVEDSAITTKVKALLLKEKGIPSTDISVETSKGRVQLSGFVPSADVVSRAGRIAAGVDGVKTVQNNLKIR
jgi:osmotically-inducible protein OsmY